MAKGETNDGWERREIGNSIQRLKSCITRSHEKRALSHLRAHHMHSCLRN